MTEFTAAERKFQRFFMAALLKYPNINAFGVRFAFVFAGDPICLGNNDRGALSSGVYMEADRYVAGEASKAVLHVGDLETASAYVVQTLAPKEDRDNALESERVGIIGGIVAWQMEKERRSGKIQPPNNESGLG